MRILGIIPARYASTRFPAKALAMVLGKSMIQRVYEQAIQAKTLSKVVVATDHQAILQHVQDFGGTAILTSEHHTSGTDRCHEVLTLMKESYDFVINIQGDEPYIQPSQIDLLAGCLRADSQIATLAKRIEDEETLFNPNTPKVLFTKDKKAIYFSRQTIPYLRNYPKEEWLKKFDYYKHIGIYAYRSDVLKVITDLTPSALELAESLEQLRWLENGLQITVEITNHETYGIDTPEDLARIEKIFETKA